MFVARDWIVYALISVIVILILWQVVTQWKLETEEAKNQRAVVLILGVVVAGVMVARYFMK
jgi:hypothetical protein